jgi:hypothetical protein
MNNKEFAEVLKITSENTLQLLKVKGAEYTNNADRLANFKRASKAIGITSLQAAFIYASKHFDSIASFVKNDASGMEQILSEPIEGRFYDLINYCHLMLAILHERKDKSACD